jgi:polar amino acid transport system substrate-binding protein
MGGPVTSARPDRASSTVTAMRLMRRRVAAVLSISTAAVLLLAACGDDDDGANATTAAPTTAATSTSASGGGATTTAAGGGTETTAASDATPASYPADPAAKACAEGKTLSPGKLVVATGQPAFGPYVIDDKPESGQGFEANLAYAVAGAMGFAPDAVSWTRTTFDGAIQPGPKDFDFNLQQDSINPDREKVVTFSDPYYAANQAILGTADSPAASATSADDFRNLKIGVAAGTTSLTFVQDVLKPTSQPFVYNDNAAAKQAIDTKQIDAIVVDLPTGIYMRDVELEGVQVYGQFTSTESGGEPWGMLFAKDNPLHECVDEALATLRKDGILDAITERWMTEGGDIRDISLG